MEEFVKFALEHIKSDVGIIAIVVLFIFSGGLTQFIAKTTTLNQKQSYVFLKILFVGLILFLAFIFVMYLKQDSRIVGNGIKTEAKGNNESNISVNTERGNGSVETIINENNNSVINISQ